MTKPHQDLQSRRDLFAMSAAAVSSLQAVAPTDLSTPAPTIAITGGKLLTVTHGAIENGVLVIADGKIAAVGAAGAVTDSRRRDRLSTPRA